MILDILASDITAVGQSDFTATTPGANDLAVNNVSDPDGLFFANAGARSCFALGDNILIQKMWCVVPWGFGQGGAGFPSIMHYFDVKFFDGTDFFDVAPIHDGVILPTLCDPLDFGQGLFCQMATTGPVRNLSLVNIKLRISQLNLPAGLNAVRIPVQYYIQVAHTLPMTLRP